MKTKKHANTKLKEAKGKKILPKIAESANSVQLVKGDAVPIINAPNGIEKATEYFLFAKWMALPVEDKKKIGIVTAMQFAQKYHVANKTLSEWKKREDFWPLVNMHIISWGKELTPTVLKALFKRSLRQDFANPKDTELWLQYVEGFNPKQQIEIKNKSSGFTENDLRVLITYLLPNEQQEFYTTFDKLIQSAKHNRAIAESRAMDTSRPVGTEMDLPEQTDFADEGSGHGNQVAKEATADIRSDLEG